MCEPSKIADDWVIKGCHIHVAGVELRVVCDHRGGVAFKPVFSNTPHHQLASALKEAIEECLPDAQVRQRWIQRLSAASSYMLNYEGELSARANGKMLEFRFLRLAIARWS